MYIVNIISGLCRLENGKSLTELLEKVVLGYSACIYDPARGRFSLQDHSEGHRC